MKFQKFRLVQGLLDACGRSTCMGLSALQEALAYSAGAELSVYVRATRDAAKMLDVVALYRSTHGNTYRYMRVNTEDFLIWLEQASDGKSKPTGTRLTDPFKFGFIALSLKHSRPICAEHVLTLKDSFYKEYVLTAEVPLPNVAETLAENLWQ